MTNISTAILLSSTIACYELMNPQCVYTLYVAFVGGIEEAYIKISLNCGMGESGYEGMK